MALTRVDTLEAEYRNADCIDNPEAVQACERCADGSAGEGGEMAECLRCRRDVADRTPLHARFVARASNYSPQPARACAAACKECAEACERYDEEHCQVCANVLRDCAETRRELAS